MPTPSGPQFISQSASQPNTGKPRKPRCWFRRVLLVLLVLLIGAGGVGWYLWKGVPKDYIAYEAYLRSLTPEKKQEMVQEVSNRFADAMSRPAGKRGGGIAADFAATVDGTSNLAEETDSESTDDGLREFTLPVQEANVWLSEELPHFAESQGHSWPRQISQMMLKVAAPHITMRFRFDSPELSQVVSAKTKPVLRGDGTATVEVESLSGGNLPLPAQSLVAAAGKNAPTPEAGKAIERAGEMLEGQPFPVRFNYDDKNDVSLVGWTCDGTNLTLRLKLEPLVKSVATVEQ